VPRKCRKPGGVAGSKAGPSIGAVPEIPRADESIRVCIAIEGFPCCWTADCWVSREIIVIWESDSAALAVRVCNAIVGFFDVPGVPVSQAAGRAFEKMISGANHSRPPLELCESTT
jgi:hypothetical protein